MATITHAGGVITPTIVLGYRGVREARSVVHPILGSAQSDVTIRPAALRSGTLELGFSGPSSEGDSHGCELVLATAGTFVINPDRDSLGMRFVVAGGSIERELEDTTRDAWIVRVPFQEVPL